MLGLSTRRTWWWWERRTSPRRATSKWTTSPATSWRRRWAPPAWWANRSAPQRPSASNSPSSGPSLAPPWNITSGSTAWTTHRTPSRWTVVAKAYVAERKCFVPVCVCVCVGINSGWALRGGMRNHCVGVSQQGGRLAFRKAPLLLERCSCCANTK